MVHAQNVIFSEILSNFLGCANVMMHISNPLGGAEYVIFRDSRSC